MRRFRYLVDPLCLICCVAYALNRFALKPLLPSAFLHGYFNDILLIPCALPPVLWLQRRMSLRHHDDPPRFGEVAFHWIIWSLLFEVAGPFIVASATGDPWDVVAYASGAVLALLCWNSQRLCRVSNK